MKWPLMVDCLSYADKERLIRFIHESDRYTQGVLTKEFEKRWSQWLGTSYSVFVSSGSAANLLILSAIKELYFKCTTPTILTSVCTWATNISSCIQMGYRLAFADISTEDFGIDLSGVKDEDVDVIFATHIMGIPSNIEAMRERFPNAIIVEDCCESHGAVYKGARVGTHGKASSFSFYFGHHMTTVEGGMISTDDKELFNLLKAKRSHGMIRDMDDDVKEKYIKENPDIDPRFLFITDGFNARASDIAALIGISQLERLSAGVEVRKENHARFEAVLAKYGENFSLPSSQGNSSFCFPFVCNDRDTRNSLKALFEEKGVETRPFLVGNIMRQPYMKGYTSPPTPNADVMHEQAFYIGNNPFLTDAHFELLEETLDEYFNMHNN